MFNNEELQTHLETSSSVDVGSLVFAEINLNSAERISKIGNYRTADLATTYDSNDINNDYTGATDSDVVIDGGFDTSADLPASLISVQENKKLLFSLEDCFNRFRPRSGINKAVYYGNTPGHYTHHSYRDMMARPRYYVPSKEDKFKYWTSFRQENGVEKGISKASPFGNVIDDAAPFVVYNEQIPTNRIIIKMQTHVGKGNYDIGYVYNGYNAYPDPFFDEDGVIYNRSVPIDWRVEYLDSDNNWLPLPGLEDGFGNDGYDIDGNPIIPKDGYLELHYGLLEGSQIAYGWYVGNTETTSIMDTFVNPELVDGDQYTQFQFINGLRIVVETMSKTDVPFELIELSPRLAIDLTGITTSFSTNKVASDLGVSGLPVGQLLTSTGSLEISDFEQVLNLENAYDSTTNPNGSIIAKYVDKNIQIKLYEIIKNVNENDYYVPIKTLYAETFPEFNSNTRVATLSLKDLYFYFESITAPQLLIRNASLSYAISMLFDSIGFSNYVYKRVPNEEDPMIPFFFVPPDTSVAQILSDLAISTQTAMFFDENNDFVLMSKKYILPELNDRGEGEDINMTFRGTIDMSNTGVIQNYTEDGAPLSNIIEVSAKQNTVFNDGNINYIVRYIQKSYGELQQAYLLDKEKTWKYKPVLLWEISGSESTKSLNEAGSQQSSYLLTAIPLNSDLTADLPQVVGGEVVNNIIDFGDGVYWIARYNGYLYANSEIIKYDAVEYSVYGIGNVWIGSVLEYENYLSKLPFGGKIYPTGRVRIYSEPYYDADGVIKAGAVAKHGRGQFGTTLSSHSAGIDQYWTNNDNIYGLTMDSKYLFQNKTLVDTVEGATGFTHGKTLAMQTSRSGIIKNFLATNYYSESEIKSMKTVQPGTIQSSALIMSGNVIDGSMNSLDHLSYIYKPLDNKFQHFGARLRIIGQMQNSENTLQLPSGSSITYTAENADPSKNVVISSSSGGLAIMVDPTTNNGYFFELMALTDDNVSAYTNGSDIFNMVFYKVRGASGATPTDTAVPEMLWSGLSTILCDDGRFTGQYRLTADENPTVYDIAVEYENIGTSKKFYLYVNNKLVGTVVDSDPLSDDRIYNSLAPFVRGNSKVMFEKVYAIGPNLAQNSVNSSDAPLRAANVFNKESDSDDSFRKYSISDSVQSTYLTGISPLQPPTYNMYYDEFGTIMREASYFNVRYDKAYPALYAKIAPTFNKLKGYAISGFVAGAYGSEFLVFNTTDMPLNLDETSGNYLRILGVTFTQESENQLTMDQYFSRKSDFSNPPLAGELEDSPVIAKKTYNDIKNSRITYGRNEFSLSTPYIQSQDAANDLMSWLVNKVTKPRKSVGLSIFAMPTLQLGDIVNFEYLSDGVDQVATSDVRFVVYNIEYSYSVSGPTMTVYLSEVV